MTKIGFYGTRLANTLILKWIEEEEEEKQWPKPDQAWYEKLFSCIAGFDSDQEMAQLKKECRIPTIPLKQEYKRALRLLARQIQQNVQVHFKALPKRVV